MSNEEKDVEETPRRYAYWLEKLKWKCEKNNENNAIRVRIKMPDPDRKTTRSRCLKANIIPGIASIIRVISDPVFYLGCLVTGLVP